MSSESQKIEEYCKNVLKFCRATLNKMNGEPRLVRTAIKLDSAELNALEIRWYGSGRTYDEDDFNDAQKIYRTFEPYAKELGIV